MEYKLPIKSEGYHKAMLMLLNIPLNLKLSNMEIDILSVVLNHNMTTIDAKSRRTIMDELDKDKFNINNYIARLRDKGALITKAADKNLYVNPSIIEIVKDKKVTFDFELV